MTQHIITGATGFVGSHLTANLLRRHDAAGVCTLARGLGGRTAAQRVADALHGLGDGQALTPHVVEADLAAPLCAVAPGGLRQRQSPLVFWHLAASLRWKRGERAEIMKTNVEGTRNALELAVAAGADMFVHVSTAYTCGALTGDISEELHSPHGFHNSYEESKSAAEHLVANYPGLPTVILRPSVVVGSSTDYSPSGSYTGLYGYLSELRRFKATLGDSHEQVRFAADRHARISFIPVDHVVADMQTAVDQELMQPTRAIYHVTGSSCTSVGDITDYMFDLLGLTDQLRLVPGPLDDPTPLERFFARRIEFFSHYIRGERRFNRALAPLRQTWFSDIKQYIDSENDLFRTAALPVAN